MEDVKPTTQKVLFQSQSPPTTVAPPMKLWPQQVVRLSNPQQRVAMQTTPTTTVTPGAPQQVWLRQPQPTHAVPYAVNHFSPRSEAFNAMKMKDAAKDSSPNGSSPTVSSISSASPVNYMRTENSMFPTISDASPTTSLAASPAVRWARDVSGATSTRNGRSMKVFRAIMEEQNGSAEKSKFFVSETDAPSSSSPHSLQIVSPTSSRSPLSNQASLNVSVDSYNFAPQSPHSAPAAEASSASTAPKAVFPVSVSPPTTPTEASCGVSTPGMRVGVLQATPASAKDAPSSCSDEAAAGAPSPGKCWAPHKPFPVQTRSQLMTSSPIRAMPVLSPISQQSGSEAAAAAVAASVADAVAPVPLVAATPAHAQGKLEESACMSYAGRSALLMSPARPCYPVSLLQVVKEDPRGHGHVFVPVTPRHLHFSEESSVGSRGS